MVEGASPQGHIFSKRGVPLGLYHVRSLVSLITPTAQAGYHAINIAGRNDSWQRMGCVIEVTPQCRVRTQFYQKISAWPFRSHQRCKRKALLPSFENFEVSTLSERSHEAMHINITFAEMIVPCPTSSSKNWSRVENHGSGVMGLSGQLVSVVSANQDTKMMWG